MESATSTHKQEIAAIERQRDMFREQQGRYRRALDVLYHVSVACRGRSSFREIFEVTYQELTAVFTLDACYLAVCDLSRPNIFRAAYMIDEGQGQHIEDQPHGNLTGMLIARRAPLLFADLAADRLQSNVPSDRFGNLAKLSRSWMGVPLLVGQDAVGVISVQSYTPNLYNSEDLDLLQRIGNVVGVALENVDLAQQQRALSQELATRVAARTEELAILSALAAEMVLQRPLPELLDRALELTLPLLGAAGGNVRRYNRAAGTLDLLAHRGLPEEDARAVASVPIEGSRIGSIVRDNQPLAVPEHLERFALSKALSPFQSLLGVPLRIGDQVVGTLAVLDTQPRAFEPQQIDLLQVIGNQIALAIEQARLLEERERQIAELRALSSIGHAAVTALDLTALLRQVHEALGGVMRPDAFMMIVYDSERGLIADGLGIDRGEEYVYFKHQPPLPGSLTEWILRERRALHFGNLPAQISQYPELTEHIIGADSPAITWLGVPLFDRAGQPIGVISVQGYTPDAFSPRDERFVEDVARQVALHVQNVRLLTERERRIRELDAIGRVGQLVSGSYDLEQIIQQVYEQLRDVTSAPVFYMVLCEPETHFITHSAYIDRGVRDEDDWRGQVARPGSLTHWMLRNREPLLLDDLLAQREQLAAMGIAVDQIRTEGSTRAWVGVPLLAKQGQPIGLISVQDYQPAQYDRRTVDFLSQVASHVSLGVQKVRLFEERERQIAENERLFFAEQEARHMADTLREVARVLSSSFDAGEVPHMILSELRKVIAYDTASILLLENNVFRMATQGRPASTEAPQHMVFRLDQLNAARLVAQRRAPLVIADTRTSPEWTPIASIENEPPLRSWMGAPLIAKGQVLGVLNISASSPNRFTARDAEVALAFASQAAVAMENARLYQESVTRVEQELEIARQIQRNLFPRALPHVEGLELAAWCLPARETGGDFYDVIQLREQSPAEPGALGLVVGDASGKSIPAAMLMAVARSIARSEARDHQTPQEVMRETNRLIAEDVPARSFVALCYATVDLRERRLALANAGQLAPLRRRSDGRIEYLEAPGSTLPLGIDPDTPYAALELALAPGDLLLFYTDGIVEAQDHHHTLFGFERLEALLGEYGELPPDDLIDRIIRAVEVFTGSAPQHDDMTIMALRIV
ncbi:MAG TPA: GAF domain-containing protein [Roseiflexaceae bacterium]|nr:GAF domain-containing protein [Roseiflexaceae bacterium]